MVYNVGYVLKENTRENGKQLKSYDYWRGMIRRCYSEKYHITHPTYRNCTVCDEWKCYDNFKEWFKINYYEIHNESTALDKDILIKGNKVYSPDTCVFVPKK
jgi:hypothetical protein